MSKALEYFNGDELSASVFLSKYALRNKSNEVVEKTPDDMHRRLAREFARIEKKKFNEPFSEAFIYELFKDFRYIIPQGSPMYGIGNSQYVSLGNCYALDSPTDSYSGICWTDEQLVQISKRRGGVGIDLSHIRPADMPTQNSSRKATGIVLFASRYSNSIREVGQDGRRGALMLTLSVHHPEVLEFAHCKDDVKKVTGANISIRFSNEFLQAVREGKKYEQRWPVSGTKPVVSRMVDAKKVWHEIVKCAHNRAEPGVLFWDNIVNESPADCYGEDGFETIVTNPCLPSWAIILTSKGIRQVKDIVVGDTIWSRSGWTHVTNKWSSGVKKVYRYGTTAGCFYGTSNHRIVCHGEKVEVGEAEAIDILAGPYLSQNHKSFDPQAIVDGMVIGDGGRHKASNKIYLCVGKDDTDYFSSEVSHLIGRQNGISDNYGYDVITTITMDELPRTYMRSVPERYIEATPSVVASFLRGLYSANGSICGQRVTLKASSFQVIEDVQLMLSSLGIRSYYTTNRPTPVTFNNGKTYLCKQSYDLNISTDRDKFQAIIGFIQEYKNEKLTKLISGLNQASKPPKKTYDIVSVDFISEEEVFDITVDNTSHTYWSQCCDVSNCAELPLCALDSCRLLVQNFFAFVANPFTPQAYFDWEKFRKYTMIAQRLMEDLVDLELECIDRIIGKVESDPEPANIKAREFDIWKRVRQKCQQGRRTGTGPTAIGDTLAALGVRYGSDESIEVVGNLYKAMKLACYRSSVDMAKELGAFPIWDSEKEKDNPFLLRIKDEDPELYADMQKYGRRNIALLTTAPCGSVSTQAGPRPYFQTTSGIEPLFTDKSFTRRKKINPSDENTRVDFVDESGDKWQHFQVYHSKIRMWMDATGETDITKSPYHGACAEDLDWRQRVKLQAAAQRHVDHSISSTLNLPADVSVEKVQEIYETAWLAGCKGITIYRKGCRDGILIEEVKEKIQKTTAPKRPKDLPCDVHFASCGGKNYFVLVGMFNNEPYEVLSAENKESAIKHSVKHGILRKVRRRFYSLLDSAGKEGFLADVASFSSDEEETVTRMVSTSLRHGADIGFVVHQLEKARGSMVSFSKCLARVLKKYIEDGTKISGEVCPECQTDSLIRQEGCVKCQNCPHSKCS